MSETDIPSNNLVLELENREEKIVFNPVGMRVLAIDANVVSLAFLVAMLKKCKYNVTSTTKAEEALEILRNSKETFDLVMTDVIRLDMDGFRLLEIVSLEMDVPVILVTAEDNKSCIMKGIRHGASHYLLKPVRIQEIKNIWQHVVRKRLSNIEKSSIMRETKSEELKASENLEATVTKKEDGEGEGKEANIEPENNSLHQKRPRLKWTQELHSKFVNAVQQLGDVLHPTKILKIMNEPGLTRDQVASHLQKYKMKLKEEKEEKEKTSQLHSETQQWMMPHDLPVPKFKELKFSSTFLSPTKLPDEYMGKSYVSLGYNVHRVPAASSSFPFCSSISNASLNAPPKVPEQAPVETGAILQHTIASGHGREKGGYFVSHPSNSGGQFNDYAHNVQYPTLTDSMKNNEWNFARHPYEKSQRVQSSFHHSCSSPSYDDLTELVQQFANDEPPKL